MCGQVGVGVGLEDEVLEQFVGVLEIPVPMFLVGTVAECLIGLSEGRRGYTLSRQECSQSNCQETDGEDAFHEFSFPSDDQYGIAMQE